MALGATTGRVQGDVIFDTLRLAANRHRGGNVGTTASITSASLIASLLFATSPGDVRTYTGMILALYLLLMFGMTRNINSPKSGTVNSVSPCDGL
jgi:hypothetical protein